MLQQEIEQIDVQYN
jgi:hypothetical protein